LDTLWWGVQKSMPRRRWTMEEKAAIVMEVLTTSTPISEICRKYKSVNII